MIDLTLLSGLPQTNYGAATVAETTACRGKAIATDDQGRVYAANGNNSIQVFNANLSTQELTITNLAGSTDVEGVATVRQGGQLLLYTSGRDNSTLTRYKLTEAGGAVTAAAVDTSFGVNGTVSLPAGASLRGVEVDSTGRVWVAGNGTNAVYVVASNGSSYQTIGSIATPMDIGFDGTSALITQATQRQISEVDIATLSLESPTITVPWAALQLDPTGQSGGGALSGIAVTASGGFYVTNESGQTANEKSTYGVIDDQSGYVDGTFYTDTNARRQRSDSLRRYPRAGDDDRLVAAGGGELAGDAGLAARPPDRPAALVPRKPPGHPGDRHPPLIAPPLGWQLSCPKNISPRGSRTLGGFVNEIRRHLLSHFWYYHRLRKLNYRVRNGNGCGLSDMVTGKERAAQLRRAGPLRRGMGLMGHGDLAICSLAHRPLAPGLVVITK